MKYDNIFYLNKAHEYAKLNSECKKVAVGALIVDIHQRFFYGANISIPSGCRGSGCEVDGHCVSTIHAEIHAIVAAKNNLYNSKIYVTRYPCESCARAIVLAGIKTVIYGRKQRISKLVDDIFFSHNVSVIHVPEFDEVDNYG